MLNGFKEFITRGNVLDLAIGIIIGGAFTAIVTALNGSILMPLVAWLFGAPDVEGFTLDLPSLHGGNATVFPIGLLLQAILNFLFVAAALYFFIVLPIAKLAEARKPTEEEIEETLEKDVELLTEIRDLLRTQTAAR
ncbi:large conductance mechanosensitive channel protein MscL [Myceligenerans sp. I2]|uniref:Large-conductance mechanosensitive channel n=2 Tax=Myceligenerans indicum TaxID=2593663 RepID=A0ABS1LQE6_9MICO|nr:large conductance mechanosensitive channel protein MscL [Myceligenerans indicum]